MSEILGTDLWSFYLSQLLNGMRSLLCFDLFRISSVACSYSWTSSRFIPFVLPKISLYFFVMVPSRFDVLRLELFDSGLKLDTKFLISAAFCTFGLFISALSSAFSLLLFDFCSSCSLTFVKSMEFWLKVYLSACLLSDSWSLFWLDVRLLLRFIFWTIENWSF